MSDLAIYEYVKSIYSKKSSIKVQKVREIKKYYMSMYHVQLLDLYDNGFISDPTLLNTQELIDNIVDLDIKELQEISGKISISLPMIRYAIAKLEAKHSGLRGKEKEVVEESLTFLNILEKAVYYKNQSDSIDLFYDDNGFSESLKAKINIKVAQTGSKIYNKAGYPFTESILECFLAEGNRLKYVSLNKEIYNVALDVLGLSDVDSDMGLFIDGLTREQEIECCDVILNGMVSLTGEYASVLEGWLKENKWSLKKKYTIEKEGLYNWVSYYSEDMLVIKAREMNKYYRAGSLFMMDSTGFFLINSDEFVDYPMGLFVISSSDSDEPLPERNILEGFTGEVKPVSYLIENQFNFVGCPIELYVNNKETELFVDISQTEFSDALTYFKIWEASYNFESEKESEHQSHNEQDIKGTLLSAINASLSGELLYKLPAGLSKKQLDLIKKEIVKELYK